MGVNGAHALNFEITKNKARPVYEGLISFRMAAGTILTWLTGKLTMSPEMQDKAYNALKAVYGVHFPDPLDIDRVEYIKALGIELWTSIRLGFSREAFKDPFIDGILVPEGTLVVYNSFQINRDPLIYGSPDAFRPERWIVDHTSCTNTSESHIPKFLTLHTALGVVYVWGFPVSVNIYQIHILLICRPRT